MSAINKQHGFTIVELLVVIVVIGILAAITLVAFNSMQQRARTSEVAAGTSQTKRKLEVHKIENGSYPTTATFAASGIVSDPMSYQYTSDGTSFCATKTSGNVSYKVSDTTNPSPGGCAGHAQGGQPLVTNLVDNPSFETNRNSWGYNGSNGTVSTVRAQSGSRSFAAVGDTGAPDTFIDRENIVVPPGTYTYSMYIYFTGSGATFGDRRAWFHCATGSCSGSAGQTYDKTLLNQWQRIVITLTATSTATLRIRTYFPEGSTTYYDSIMVTTGSTAYPYLDGNSTNWAWSGAVNNSTSSGPAP